MDQAVARCCTRAVRRGREAVDGGEAEVTEIWQPPKDQPPHPGWWKASDGRWYPPRTPPTPAAPSVIYVEKAASNGLAVAALVLGIIGVVVGLIPLFFFIALPLGVLAFVFGLIGRS